MKNYYLIIKILGNEEFEILNITSNYYHFRRLLKKYKNEKNIINRKISSYELFKNSKYL